MKQVILYNKVTGKIIYSSLTTNARMLEKTLARDSNLAYIEGSVEKNKYQVNVSVEPHVIEEKPPVTISVPGWIRDNRHNRLKGTDWTVGADSPLSDSKKAEWQTYRQALRDLPSSYSSAITDRDSISWPTKPS